jgi:serine/threonine protein kinase
MLRAGTQIGAYTVDGVIGHGGMGVVYRARQVALGRAVALKLLSSELSDDDRFRERFRREATLQAAIEHPNIVPVYEANESAYGLYIAMRLVPGPTLHQMIRAGDLDPARAISILRGVASALDSAHARGLIHRDVKPANVLVVQDHSYLADFGLTKATGVESITRTGPLLGTLDYVAPEQIRGEEADAHSDIYSLGAVLYECLTGSVPFMRATDVAVMYAHLEQKPPSVRRIHSELPGAVDRVIKRAMAKAPSERHDSAGDLIADAAVALRETPRRVRRPRPRPSGPADTSVVPEPPRRARRVSRLRARLLIGAAAPALALAGLAFGLSVPSPSTALGSTRTIKANGASIRVPRNWANLPPGSPVPGLFYHDKPTSVPRGVAGATPPNQSGAGVLVGRVAAFGPGLLPGPISNIATFTSPATAVRLNDLDALHYSRVMTNDGTQSIELYLVPTTNNVVGVACYAPPGRPDDVSLEKCGQIAATVHLISGRPFTLGARPAYKTLLTRALDPLAARLSGLVHSLFIAPTTTAQRKAAGQLASAYRRAASQLTALPIGTVSPTEGGINIGIRDSLRGVASAYESVAAAALRRDSTAYNTALNDVRTAVTELGASFLELTKLGYILS